MRTIRLESMVEYLSGREGEAAPAIRAAMADPSSEASRFLEEVRSRSRALVPTQTSEPQLPARPVARSARPWRLAANSALAASILLASGSALWFGQARLDRLESALERREAEARAEARRLETALALVVKEPTKVAAAPTPSNPRPHPIEQALARVEVGLDRLDRRIEGLDRPAPEVAPVVPPEAPPAETDPAIAEIRRDVAGLRRELVASDKAGARQVAEIRMALQEVGSLLRLVLSRPGSGMQGINLNTIPQDPMAAQALSIIGNLGNPQAETRLESVQQLERMGAGAQFAVPTLEQLLRQETDPRVRSATQSALRAIGPP
ncbi:hypothetical protein P12x_005062 [Tundrisphaera lichenicola]|uniref:hypothetical protein n=1 Tax=Tundrisphaera lichenicola TaxID=2029860 RepID=UPI003EBEBC2C